MGGKGKILVVDDDRLVLATVTHGLAQAGYEVIDADNGDDAILLARQHRPDLALLDIRMEGMSGFDVAAYLREYLQTPFMFLSAFSDDQTVEQVKALGAVAYLVKPLDVGQIVPTVEAAFATIAAERGVAPRAGEGHARASNDDHRCRSGCGAARGRRPRACQQRRGGRRDPDCDGHRDAPLFAVSQRGARSPATPGACRRPQPEGAGRAAGRGGGAARPRRRGPQPLAFQRNAPTAG